MSLSFSIKDMQEFFFHKSRLNISLFYLNRMDSSKVDSTKRIKDFFETPMPRTNPTTDMKYINLK